MFDLLSLPARVLSDALGSGLSLRDLVRLDSAMCQKNIRELWLASLSTKSFTLQKSVSTSTVNLKWLTSKSLKVQTLVFWQQLDPKALSAFLRICGSSVHEAFFRGNNREYEMLIVGLYCTQVKVIKCFSLELNSIFADLLWKNENIRVILLDFVYCKDTSAFLGVHLPMLTSLTMLRMTDPQNLAMQLTCGSSCLSILMLELCTRTRLYAFHVFPTRKMWRFSADGSDISSNCVTRISLSAISLSNMSLMGCDHIQDEGVLSVVKQLTSLRKLNIKYCALLTDTCLEHISTHACKRLEMLYTDIKNPVSAETETILDTFAQMCVALTCLNINCGTVALCAGKGTAFLLRGLPQLQTLIVNKSSTITMSSRIFAETMRPNLQILVHNKTTEYNILTM